MPNQPHHTAIIYLRQSTYREESASLSMQETSAREHCTRQGYRVADVIQDPGVSGLAWDKREGIQQVLKRVEAGDADRVVVWRWSRLSRKQLHQHLAIERLESAGAVVESSTEPFDTETSGGVFGRNVMLAAADFESRQKGDQWRETHHRRLSEGLPAHGRHRYGYTWHHGPGVVERYEVDPDEAEVVRWMYHSFCDGMGMPGVARELNRSGVTRKNGKRWGVRSVLNVLESGFAAGLLAQNVVYPGTSQLRPFGERSWVPGAHEAIIDEVTWSRFKAVKLQRAVTPARTINPTNVLSGLVKCGDCGGPMVRQIKSKNNFSCQRRMYNRDVATCNIREWRLINLVREWLEELADEVGDAARRAEQVQQAQLTVRTDSDQAEKDIAEYDRQLANLTNQLVAGRVPEDTYDRVRDELLVQRGEAEQRRAVAQARQAQPAAESPHVTARTVLDEWDTLPVATLRTMLSQLMEGVVVDPPAERGQSAQPRIVDVWSGDQPEPGSSGETDDGVIRSS